MILNLRKKCNLSQNELGNLLFVSQKTISAYEKGIRTPSIEMVPKLAEILDCSIEEVVRALIKTKIQAQQKH